MVNSDQFSFSDCIVRNSFLTQYLKGVLISTCVFMELHAFTPH